MGMSQQDKFNQSRFSQVFLGECSVWRTRRFVALVVEQVAAKSRGIDRWVGRWMWIGKVVTDTRRGARR